MSGTTLYPFPDQHPQRDVSGASIHAEEPAIVGQFAEITQGAMLAVPMNHAVLPPSRPADFASRDVKDTANAPGEATAAAAESTSEALALAPVNAAAPAVQRVVLDTQIVMDWLVFNEPGVMPIIALVESRHLLWTATSPMKAEMLHVLGRGVAARYVPDLDRIEAAFARHCELVAEPVLGMARPRCSDADDQKFIDLALHLALHQPTVLISRDRAVLKVAKRAARLGLEIVAPQLWIKRRLES